MKKLRVFIDDAPLNSGHKFRGMGMYTRNLISSLNTYPHQYIDYQSGMFSQDKHINADIIHFPYFDLFYPTLKIPSRIKTVVTVPDVIPLLYPKLYKKGFRGSLSLFKQKRNLMSVDKIVTISETSKKDIVRLLDVNADKISVVHLAPSFIFKKNSIYKKTLKKYGLPEKYVLYVGDLNWNKNVSMLARACIKNSIPLVVVGKAAVDINFDNSHYETYPIRDFQQNFAKNPLIFTTGFISDSELNDIWNGATVYCQPSLYEGFGLPVVEAFNAHVPVISSRTQALVEIAGNAALFTDAADIDIFSHDLEKIFNSTSLQKELIRKGSERLINYSWKKFASQMHEVYSSLI